MARIFTFGETVYDIIFRDAKPVAAKAGGSMLNTSVSLGRLGLDVNFISDIGKDMIGDHILSFLTENGINTGFIESYINRKTALAIAFLDENNDASYTFYKDYPDSRLNSLDPDFEEGDIVLFGSFFGITESLRLVLKRVLNKAHDNRCIIIYDPNFRKAHLHELDKLKPYIIENIRICDIVRGSDEDFNIIFGANNSREAFDMLLDLGCGNLIYTANRNDVIMMTQDYTITSAVPPITPVSTIGAGDSFNAGLIWTLIREEISKKNIEHLPISIIEKIIANGIYFSSEVCMSYENYISRETASGILNS